MDIYQYLKPDNPLAQGIVYALNALFVLWFFLLLWNLVWALIYRRQIERCEDVSQLLERETGPREAGGVRLLELPPITRSKPSESVLHSPAEGERIFDGFREARKLEDKNPIARHLRAIFIAGWNESQLDARSLIKNTADRLFRGNSLLRSLLSIFIILGLLGTLLGLADTLASLISWLQEGAQLNSNTLSQGLQRLLTPLKGAFAPSILGVFLTILGVVLFAFYVRYIALPAGNLLERVTLTVWIPQLVPTASQKLLDKLQLSERQMQRSFAAAQEVAEFAENIQSKTGAFNQTLGRTTSALMQMTEIADHLGAFSQNFVEGVKALVPFQQDLRTLYQQMVSESRAFQESVQRNITGAEDFQRRIQEQLGSQHQQLARILGALQSYEAAYVASRERIDEKLETVLTQAELAFQNLSRRNEEIGQALDNALGKPLRADLTQSLSGVQKTLDEQLGQVESTLQVQLSSLGDRLRSLDAPLNDAATKFTDTFHNFNEHTDEWRTTLQREFIQQNETNQSQLRRLEMLSQQIPELLQQLSSSSNNFSESSNLFAERGQQLSQHVTALSENIAALQRSVDMLSEKVKTDEPKDDGSIVDLLSRQTLILQTLAKRVEHLTESQLRPRSSSVSILEPARQPEPRWRDRILNWIPFRRR